jgi:hypothetical protein
LETKAQEKQAIASAVLSLQATARSTEVGCTAAALLKATLKTSTFARAAQHGGAMHYTATMPRPLQHGERFCHLCGNYVKDAESQQHREDHRNRKLDNSTKKEDTVDKAQQTETGS